MTTIFRRPEFRSPYPYFYMATPYRKYPGGLDAAALRAEELAAELIDRGVNVYSPIVHSHALARHTRLSPMDDRWLDIDMAFMRPAQGLIIVKMPNWEISSGIAGEQSWFKVFQRPIFLLDDPLPPELPGGLKCLL
jgi:hypothetical protein